MVDKDPFGQALRHASEDWFSGNAKIPKSTLWSHIFGALYQPSFQPILLDVYVSSNQHFDLATSPGASPQPWLCAVHSSDLVGFCAQLCPAVLFWGFQLWDPTELPWPMQAMVWFHWCCRARMNGFGDSVGSWVLIHCSLTETININIPFLGQATKWEAIARLCLQLWEGWVWFLLGAHRNRLVPLDRCFG